MQNIIILILQISLTVATWQGKLQFNQDNTFTVLQIADLHYGESDSQDQKSTELQFTLIRNVKPDLVVYSGDQFAGYTRQCGIFFKDKECFQKGWLKYTHPVTTMNQKFATILGNHDAEANLKPKQIIELDMTHSYSLTQQSPVGVKEGTNYNLPLYDANGQNIEGLLWFFDSHHEKECQGQYSKWGCVENDQIEWFNNEYKRLLYESRKWYIQGISFVHIPPPEYVDLYNEFEVYGSKNECRHSIIIIEPTCSCYNTGYVDALMNNNVQANFAGHDHNNDYGGTYRKNNKKIELVYGRKSGYGSYGPEPDMLNGGTIIKITSLGQGKLKIDQQIIDENGVIFERQKPYRRTDKLKGCLC